MRRKHGVLRLGLVEAVVPDVHVDLFRDRQVLSALLKLTRERENPCTHLPREAIVCAGSGRAAPR